MKDSFEILRSARVLFSNMIGPYSVEQLNFIPEEFNNNLIWNYGHVLVTQQLLTYGLSKVATPVSTEIIDRYRKGTAPQAPVDQVEINELKKLSISMVDVLETDYNNNMFSNFQTYTTSMGIILDSVEKAIEFNNAHEMMHFGTCLAIKKFV